MMSYVQSPYAHNYFHYVGSVPSFISSLSALLYLDLGDNSLTGEIPTHLQNDYIMIAFLIVTSLCGTIVSMMMLQDLFLLPSAVYQH